MAPPIAPAGRCVYCARGLDSHDRWETVYYALDGLFFGRESYSRGINLIHFQTSDGRCVDGTWFNDSQRRAYCYAWPSQLTCFWYIERDDEVLVIDVDGGQTGIWDIETVSSIAEGGFTCHSVLTS